MYSKAKVNFKWTALVLNKDKNIISGWNPSRLYCWIFVFKLSFKMENTFFICVFCSNIIICLIREKPSFSYNE